MANCPKCGYKLKLTDWRPECPKCGVNVIYYNIEERLREDADKAELEQAKFQPRMDRLKASVYGSPLAIVRVVLMVLTIVTIVAPLGQITTTLPFGTASTTVNAVAIYNLFNYLDIGLLFKLMGQGALSKGFIFYGVALITLLLSVVCMLLNLVFLVMSFGKRGFKRNIITNAVGIFFAAVACVAFTLCCNGFGDAIPAIFSGHLGWGVILVFLGFISVIVVNVLFKTLKIEVAYTDVSELLLPYKERKAYKEEQERLAKESDASAAAAALKEAQEKLKEIQEQEAQHHHKKK